MKGMRFGSFCCSFGLSTVRSVRRDRGLRPRAIHARENFCGERRRARRLKLISHVSDAERYHVCAGSCSSPSRRYHNGRL